MLLKNGGWRGCGEFCGIAQDVVREKARVQVVGWDTQIEQNGQRRSRQYWELRTPADVIQLGAAVRSKKQAIAEANRRFGAPA